MQVKMLECVQGRDIFGALPNGMVVPVLEPGTVYEVDEQLGAWLLENRKAEKVEAEAVKKVEAFLNPDYVFVEPPSEDEYLAKKEQELQEEHKNDFVEEHQPRRKRGKRSEG